MVGRNETKFQNEAGGNETSGITYFAVHDIGITPRFVLPCFAAGCHVDHLKIATAAVRPRNDTKLERFYLETDVSRFMRSFFARYCSAWFFKRFVPKIVPFSAKPTKFVIARSDSDAAILNETRRHSGTNYGGAERCSISPVFCDRDSFLRRAPVLRYGMPRRSLKDCHGRSAASQ